MESQNGRNMKHLGAATATLERQNEQDCGHSHFWQPKRAGLQPQPLLGGRGRAYARELAEIRPRVNLSMASQNGRKLKHLGGRGRARARGLAEIGPRVNLSMESHNGRKMKHLGGRGRARARGLAEIGARVNLSICLLYTSPSPRDH